MGQNPNDRRLRISSKTNHNVKEHLHPNDLATDRSR